jgi:hypothetical protein
MRHTNAVASRRMNSKRGLRPPRPAKSVMTSIQRVPGAPFQECGQ